MKKRRKSICGTLQEQIDRLKAEVGKDGLAKAKKIVETNDPAVVKLAFKMLPKTQSAQIGLGKRIESLLKNVPAAQRENMRTMLLKAKRKG